MGAAARKPNERCPSVAGHVELFCPVHTRSDTGCLETMKPNHAFDRTPESVAAPVVLLGGAGQGRR